MSTVLAHISVSPVHQLPSVSCPPSGTWRCGVEYAGPVLSFSDVYCRRSEQCTCALHVSCPLYPSFKVCVLVLTGCIVSLLPVTCAWCLLADTVRVTCMLVCPCAGTERGRRGRRERRWGGGDVAFPRRGAGGREGRGEGRKGRANAAFQSRGAGGGMWGGGESGDGVVGAQRSSDNVRGGQGGEGAEGSVGAVVGSLRESQGERGEGEKGREESAVQVVGRQRLSAVVRGGGGARGGLNDITELFIRSRMNMHRHGPLDVAVRVCE